MWIQKGKYFRYYVLHKKTRQTVEVIENSGVADEETQETRGNFIEQKSRKALALRERKRLSPLAGYFDSGAVTLNGRPIAERRVFRAGC
jgi:hypothetical protein